MGKNGRESSEGASAHSRTGLNSREQAFCTGKADFGDLFELTGPAEGGARLGRVLAKVNGVPAENTAKSKR